LRRNYAADLITNSPRERQKIIFIDESGFNLHLRRSQARSTRGNRSSIEATTNKGTNRSLTMTINRNRVIHFSIKVGGVKAIDFAQFIREIFVEVVDNNSNLHGSWFVMDYARIHHHEVVKSVFEEFSHCNCELKFLSPYSFMLNPIEKSFSKVKWSIRQSLAHLHLNNREIILEEEIENAIASLAENDLQNYFLDMFSNISLALERHHF